MHPATVASSGGPFTPPCGGAFLASLAQVVWVLCKIAAPGLLAVCVVLGVVLGLAQDHQIFWSVVITHVVEVVNVFIGRQVAANYLLHYQPVLQYVSLAAGLWVLWHVNRHVSSALMHQSPTLPLVVLLSGLLRRVPMDVRLRVPSKVTPISVGNLGDFGLPPATALTRATRYFFWPRSVGTSLVVPTYEALGQVFVVGLRFYRTATTAFAQLRVHGPILA